MLRLARRLSPRQAALSVLPIVLAATACGADGAAETEAVKARIAREVEAVNARDLQALSQIWSQDAGITLFDIAPPGRIQGWQGIAKSFSESFDRLAEVHMTVDQVEVRIEGSLAWATYDWTMTGKMGEAILDDKGQATAIYRREKDGWKLVHAHYSATLQPPSGTPEAPATGASAAPGGAATGGGAHPAAASKAGGAREGG
jgi:ketosteroid isomerase-like protein